MHEFLMLTGISFLTVHEMDAIRLKEWRMFWYLNTLDEVIAFRLFTLAHIPLYHVLFWGLFNHNMMIRSEFEIAFNLFLIIHLFLHIAFLKHRNNQFKSVFSWVLIMISALSGALYFMF